MSEKNIKRMELAATILLISIAAVVSFNIAIVLFVTIVLVRAFCAWLLYKKHEQEEKAKKDLY